MRFHFLYDIAINALYSISKSINTSEKINKTLWEKITPDEIFDSSVSGCPNFTTSYNRWHISLADPFYDETKNILLQLLFYLSSSVVNLMLPSKTEDLNLDLPFRDRTGRISRFPMLIFFPISTRYLQKWQKYLLTGVVDNKATTTVVSLLQDSEKKLLTKNDIEGRPNKARLVLSTASTLFVYKVMSTLQFKQMNKSHRFAFNFDL